jgi:hypothetical protein
MDFVYVCLCAILIPIIRRDAIHADGYEEEKDRWFLVISGLFLAAVLLFGRIPGPGGLGGYALCFFCAYAGLSLLWSKLPRNAGREVMRWSGLLLLYLAAGTVDRALACEALVLTSCVVSLYGMVQQIWARDPIHKGVDQALVNRHKRTRFYSFLGNSNYTGSYLSVTFFAALYLASEVSPWWYGAVGLIGASVAMTQCRAAVLAVIAGFALLPKVWPVAFFLGGVAVIIFIAAPETFLSRWYYAQICYRIWKKSPIFGSSANIFRRSIFWVQAEMNREDPTFLGTPQEPGRNTFPVGKRAHNDHAEILCEYGIVGYGLFGLFVGATLWDADMGFLAAGFLAGIVNAAFFYSLRLSETAVPIMIVAGLTATPGAGIEVPLTIAGPLALLALWLVWVFPGRAWMREHYFQRSFQAPDEKDRIRAILKAGKFDPDHNRTLWRAAMLTLQLQPAKAFDLLLRMIHHNDGEQVLWQAYDLLGRAALINGAMLYARDCFATAIYLNPRFPPAYEGAAQVEGVLKQVEEQMKKGAST